MYKEKKYNASERSKALHYFNEVRTVARVCNGQSARAGKSSEFGENGLNPQFFQGYLGHF